MLGKVEVTHELVLEPDPVDAAKKLEQELAKWGHFTIVEDPARADLVLVVIEGNSAAMVVKALLIERLLVFQGGESPTNRSVVLWQTEVKQGIGGRPMGQLVKALRKQIEEYENVGVTVAAKGAPPSSPAAPAPAKPTQSARTEVGATRAGQQASGSVEPSGPEQVRAAENPLLVVRVLGESERIESLLAAKTVAVVASGPTPPGGAKGIFGWIVTGSAPLLQPNAPRAKKDVEWALEKWKRYTVMDDPAKADLVFHITEWEHGDRALGARLTVLKGGVAWNTEPVKVWFKERQGNERDPAVTIGLVWDLRRYVDKLAKQATRTQ